MQTPDFSEMTPEQRAIFVAGMKSMSFLILAGWFDYRKRSLDDMSNSCAEIRDTFVSENS
jgi:hypothetical protein